MLRVSVTLALVLVTPQALAGSFDEAGDYLPDPTAIATVDFGSDFDPEEDRYVPADLDPVCEPVSFQVVEGTDALDREHYLHVQTDALAGCAERFLVTVPPGKSSYRATLWVRHGSVDAQLTVVYPEESGLETLAAKMGPTGRTTSDGWIELASNELPVDGDLADAVYLRVYDLDSVGSDIDTLEIIPAGSYWEAQSCAGVTDPVCGEAGICVHNRCRLGRLYVPPLPGDDIKNDVVDAMQSLIQNFFGGRKTRLSDLPKALDVLESIRGASDPWTFWNGWARSFRLLHDWHTEVGGPIHGIERRARLNACFFEGDADLSQHAWPSHPQYKDVLVSHAGVEGTQGLAAGDRLVAVDGKHPIAWALSLNTVNWDHWQANDDGVYAELTERMRSLILEFATSYSVIHCHAATLNCDPAPTTYKVADLPSGTGNQVRCDNRPFYHLGPGLDPSANHNVGFQFYRGPVIEATPEEAIYALVWDTLYGGGEPSGFVNQNLKDAFADFKANARGVILDHRAGSGGTLDGAETATELVRPPQLVAVFMSPIPFAAFDGPATLAEGVDLFQAFKTPYNTMTVGSTQYDPAMPVAVLIHRDGSASDFFPFGVKGYSDKVKIFGPAPTAGAFSTYFQFRYWGGLSWRMASGDTISFDGRALIGNGVAPDIVVLQKQSDLLAGKDTIHEAALAWLRTELKP